MTCGVLLLHTETAMTTCIRPYAPDDLSRAEELEHSVFPEYAGDPPWRPGWHFEAPQSCSAKYVAADSATGRLIGYASVRHVGSLHYRANLMVHPACRRSGIGGALFSALWDQLVGPLQAACLQVRVRKDQGQGLAFVRRRNFEYIHEMRGRSLDLNHADQSVIQSLARRCDPEVILITLSELRTQNADADAQVVGVYLQSQTGWPDPDPYMVHNSQDVERQVSVLVRNAKRPDRFLVALTNGRPVGFNGGESNCVGLAVHPDCRGRGIAGALTAAEITELKREGSAVFFSCSANPAMHKIYDRLGCQDWFSEVRFVKRIEARGTRANNGADPTR